MSEQMQKEYDATIARMFKEKMATHPVEFQKIAPSEAERCRSEHDGYGCTLQAGHTCDHVAHGTLGYIHHRWNDAGEVSTGNVTDLS